MPEISTAELAAMRADSLLLQPETASITDPGSVTTSPDGGTVISGPTTTTGVPARLSRTGTQAVMVEFGEQIVSDADYILTCPVGTALEAGWSVTISGNAYTVLSVGRTPTWGTAVRAAIQLTSTVGG